MKINTESNHIYNTQHIGAFEAKGANATSFSSALSTAIAESSPTKQLDFNNMSRKDMAEWTNSQIRSGDMSFEDSVPFRLMYMKIPLKEGQTMDMGNDPTPINFFERASSGIEFARSSNDPELAKKLQAAIDKMYRHQGQATDINLKPGSEENIKASEPEPNSKTINLRNISFNEINELIKAGVEGFSDICPNIPGQFNSIPSMATPNNERRGDEYAANAKIDYLGQVQGYIDFEKSSGRNSSYLESVLKKLKEIDGMKVPEIINIAV